MSQYGCSEKDENFQRWFCANGSLLVSFAIFKITRITTLRKVSSSSRLLKIQTIVNIGGRNMGAQKKTKNFQRWFYANGCLLVSFAIFKITGRRKTHLFNCRGKEEVAVDQADDVMSSPSILAPYKRFLDANQPIETFKLTFFCYL